MVGLPTSEIFSIGRNLQVIFNEMPFYVGICLNGRPNSLFSPILGHWVHLYTDAPSVLGGRKRCLTRFDLAKLGIGHTFSVGLFAIIGAVAVRVAGPSIVISFLIAAVCSILAGLCYAELGSRISALGNAYVYTYCTVGEFIAFLVGWNMILESLFGTACIAKAMSRYFDVALNDSLSEFFIDIVPIDTQSLVLNDFWDIFAFVTVIILGVILSCGVKHESLSFNNLCAIGNLIVVVVFLITGMLSGLHTSYWFVPKEDIVNVLFDAGKGGFFPYGFFGTLQGAAVVFYGFAGFDTIATSTEHSKKSPQHIVPHAIMTVLGISLFLYLAVCIVLTMMVPYFLLDKAASIATTFGLLGWVKTRTFLALLCFTGLLASLLAAMVYLPRLLYTMASDRLMPHFCANIYSKTKTPIIATMLPAVITAILTSVLMMEELVYMMCVGTFISYSFIAVSVLMIRYRCREPGIADVGFFQQIMGRGPDKPCKLSSRIVHFLLLCFIIICAASAVSIKVLKSFVIPVVILNIVLLLIIVVITLQPQDKEHLPPFKTPLVPIVPLLSIYANVHLMNFLKIRAGIRILIWLAVSIPLYFLLIWIYKREIPPFGEPGVHPDVQDDSRYEAYPDVVDITNDTSQAAPKHRTQNKQQVEGEKGLQIRDEPTNMTPPRENSLSDNLKPVEPNVYKTDEIVKEKDIFQQSSTDNNEDKEAKIIGLLDQVLQAEEDSYMEIISLKEHKVEDENMVRISVETIPHRKSVSDLSDAGSDASYGNHVLSKYDVIVQVHREDLSKVCEDIEQEANVTERDIYDFRVSKDIANKDNIIGRDVNVEYEEVTAFNDSDTNSRTDESGYSDTIDRSALNDSTEYTTNDTPYIPVPPPLDEKYFAKAYFQKSYTVPSRPRQKPTETEDVTKPSESVQSSNPQDDVTIVWENNEQTPYIPVPPPLDEKYFTKAYFQKSYTVPSRPRQKSIETEEVIKPRESIQSSNSQDDGTIVWGSDRQMNFMSKLNNLYQNKISSGEEGLRQVQRSNSTGDVIEKVDVINRERPRMFLDLKKEILAAHSTPNLKPVNSDTIENQTDSGDETADSSMSREDLKSKLESIFASGGPKLIKPRLIKSNPEGTPDDSYQTDNGSTESVQKLPKIEKNDTLKRQKDKFGEVLNSFRLSLNIDDVV